MASISYNQYTESGLTIRIPASCGDCEFDNDNTHGVSFMKRVDFIIPTSELIFFVEIKSFGGNNVPAEHRNYRKTQHLIDKTIDDCTYKYRDSWIYQWNEGKIREARPCVFVVILLADFVKKENYKALTKRLGEKLPLRGPDDNPWDSFATQCIVTDVGGWAKLFSHTTGVQIS